MPAMTSSRIRSRTQIGIVGAGPAGLMLSHLLARAGIDSVVVDLRSRREIEQTHRAGILEQDSVDLLVGTGVSARVHRDGYRHDGIELAFGGGSHRIDFQQLVGASTQLYPQTDVFVDLADARERDGGDVRFGVTDVSVDDIVSDSPVLRFTDATAPATRSAPTSSWAPTDHEACAAARYRKRHAPSTSAHTPSPGSGSSPRHRPAHRS